MKDEAGEDVKGVRPDLGASSGSTQRWQRVLRVRITDVETEREKVDLRLPAGLVGVAQRLGAQLLPPGHAVDLAGAIERGNLALPMVVVDEQNAERVEISLE